MEGIVRQSDAVNISFENFRGKLTGPIELPGADIGIHDLNMAIGGHIRKKLTTIAGRSGMGKTATIIPMFESSNRVVCGRKPTFMFLTWESPAEEIVDRYISFKTGLPWRNLFQLTRLLSRSQIADIERYYSEASSLPIVYQELSTDYDHIRKLVRWFTEVCNKKQEGEKNVELIPVIILDYIGMAKLSGSRESRTSKLSELMNQLKGLAKEFDCHIIPLAQINRSADSKDLPGRDDLSDSQGIEQASDNLIVIHRPEYQGNETITIDGRTETSKGKAMFRILKGRSFGTGDIITNCDIRSNRFWSLSHTDDFKFWELYDDELFWKKTFGI